MFLFNKYKEYYSCEHLEHGICFDMQGIYHCCPYMNANSNIAPISSYSGNVDKDYKDFFKKKLQDVKNAKKSKLRETCKKCFQLKKMLNSDNKEIRTINIFANKTCNADCIYCSSHIDREYFNSMQDRPVFAYIEKLIKENRICKNCNILFAGGEPTLHFEFEKTLTLLLNYGAFIRVNTSAIKYSQAIETAIRNGNSCIVVSLDSGNPELYKAIKNVDKFYNVVENLKKYCSVINTVNSVILKYVVIPEVNDEDKYVLEFLQVARDVGCKKVCFDLDYNWYVKNRDNENLVSSYNSKIMGYKDKIKDFGLLCP